MSNIMLHACCGPCSLEPTRLLAQEGHTFAIFFFNPNIHPAAEYQHRLETLRAWADAEGIRVIEGEYDPRAWEQQAGSLQRAGAAQEERCRACYRMRLEAAAKAARELGFDALSSTLNVSPYQFNDIIHEETDRAAEAEGLESVFRDFRPFYPEATRRSRELGMYRQNYCGCHYSKDEADAEREERKAKRAQQKAERAKKRAEQEALQQKKKAERQAYELKQRAKRAARDAARRATKDAGDRSIG